MEEDEDSESLMDKLVDAGHSLFDDTLTPTKESQQAPLRNRADGGDARLRAPPGLMGSAIAPAPQNSFIEQHLAPGEINPRLSRRDASPSAANAKRSSTIQAMKKLREDRGNNGSEREPIFAEASL